MAEPNQWTVTTQGHRGDVVVIHDGPPPPSFANSQQVIFFRAPGVPLNEGERNYITIENEGPSDMQVWVDPPDVLVSAPVLVLAPGQSSSVSAAQLVFVRPASPPKVKGNYVLSWCCPTPPRAVGVLPPRGGGQPGGGTGPGVTGQT